MFGFDVPNCGVAVITYECCVGRYFDSFIAGHNYISPEGIIGTFNSITTMYMGLHFSRII